MIAWVEEIKGIELSDDAIEQLCKYYLSSADKLGDLIDSEERNRVAKLLKEREKLNSRE